MKKLSIIIFSALLITLLGCNTTQKNEPVVLKYGITEKLEQNIEKLKKENQNITPSIALNAIIEIYNSKNKVDVTNENPIDLYVLYSSDYWSEDSEYKAFEITFAHQVVNEYNGPLYEYRITMSYDRTPFDGIEEFDLRYSRNKDNLDTFKEAVQKSDGFKLASGLSVKRIEIIGEKI